LPNLQEERERERKKKTALKQLYQYIRPERYIKKSYSVPSGKNDFIQLALLLWYQSSLFIYLFICLFIWYLLFYLLFFTVK